MPTTDVEEDKEIPTFAEMLYYNYQHDGLGFTIDSLKQQRESLPTFYPKSTEEEKIKMLQILKLEIIMKFCHYAENLAAVAITFNKKFDSSNEEMLGLFDKIYEYQISEVIEFYEKISDCNLDFIAKFLGYPCIQLQNEIGREKIVISCEFARSYLKIIAKNYLEFRALYNSYKHGYRVFPAKDQHEQDAFGFIDKGKQKLSTADDKVFEEIIKSSKNIEQIFKLILNHAARAEMEKRGERNVPLDLKFFVKKKGVPHDPKTKMMFSARGNRRTKNQYDRERLYEKFKQKLETEHMGEIVVFDLDSETIIAVSKTTANAVKTMHENISSGRKGIRKIGPDPKTGLDDC